MTASLLILTVSLAALHLSMTSEPTRPVWRCAMTIAGLAVLPLAFGPIVPIAHFTFESTGGSMLSAAQSIVAVLVAALIWRIGARWRNGGDAEFLILFIGIAVGQAIWLGSSICVSDYEQGVTTPSVWGAPVYVVDWLAAIGMCVLLALATWRAAKSSVAYRLLTGIYFLLLAVLAVATVS
jgi:hypothetical protein